MTQIKTLQTPHNTRTHDKRTTKKEEKKMKI